MKRKQIMTLCIFALLLLILSTTAFAIDESEVESAIAASSQEEVAGNVFIWFLCAVAFLKISQKIDSFMSSLGINVGRTGGSMLAELMIAGRALGGAVKATGGAVGGIFNRNHTSNSTTNRAAGQAFTGGGNKPRNREKRTKPLAVGATISVKLQVPRDAYNQYRELERSRRLTKEDIFLCGLRTCADQ